MKSVEISFVKSADEAGFILATLLTFKFSVVFGGILIVVEPFLFAIQLHSKTKHLFQGLYSQIFVQSHAFSRSPKLLVKTCNISSAMFTFLSAKWREIQKFSKHSVLRGIWLKTYYSLKNAWCFGWKITNKKLCDFLH